MNSTRQKFFLFALVLNLTTSYSFFLPPDSDDEEFYNEYNISKDYKRNIPKLTKEHLDEIHRLLETFKQDKRINIEQDQLHESTKNAESDEQMDPEQDQFYDAKDDAELIEEISLEHRRCHAIYERYIIDLKAGNDTTWLVNSCNSLNSALLSNEINTCNCYNEIRKAVNCINKFLRKYSTQVNFLNKRNNQNSENTKSNIDKTTLTSEKQPENIETNRDAKFRQEQIIPETHNENSKSNPTVEENEHNKHNNFSVPKFKIPQMSQDELETDDLPKIIEGKIRLLNNHEFRKKNNTRINSMLLEASPGIGKYVAKIIATKTKHILCEFNANKILNSHIYHAEDILCTVFKRAKASKIPTIIFIDELDAITTTTNEIGAIRLGGIIRRELDRLKSNYNILCIAAINNLRAIDEATRSRFTTVSIPFLSENRRYKIISGKCLKRGIRVKDKLIRKLAKQTSDWSIRDITNTIKNARNFALSENATEIGKEQLMQAFNEEFDKRG